MNTKQHIVVWINTEGAITIDTVGYTGSSCEEATAFLESQLGIVGSKQRTSDWYRRAANRNHNPNQQNQQL